MLSCLSSNVQVFLLVGHYQWMTVHEALLYEFTFAESKYVGGDRPTNELFATPEMIKEKGEPFLLSSRNAMMLATR